jgi:formiminotetrahydrofolate cyclodeaminase
VLLLGGMLRHHVWEILLRQVSLLFSVKKKKKLSNSVFGSALTLCGSGSGSSFLGQLGSSLARLACCFLYKKKKRERLWKKKNATV